MKKQIVILSLMIMATQSLYGVPENQMVLMTVVSGHNAAFGAGNMYNEALKTDDLRKWAEAMQAVKDFIVNNSKKNKKQLMNYFTTIKAASDEMINGIKACYGMVALYGDNSEAIARFSDVFTSIDRRMKLVQQELEWVPSKVDVENQATKLVSNLARFVGVTARKAKTDLNAFNVNG
jgi:hypothetical protein